MIRTITESEALTLAVRGDVPGALDGAEALVIQTCLDCEAGAVEIGHCAACGEPKVRSCPSCGGTGGDRALLLANPLVQAHLVGWLGRGEKCPLCLGRGKYEDALPSEPLLTCWNCRGVGRIRPRHNRYAWLTPEAHGGLPDWIRMALIWGSVVRVAAGMGPIVDVLGAPWRNDPKLGRQSLDYENGDNYAVEAPSHAWKAWRLRVTRERNTREILGRFGSRAEADAEALSLGVAITDETPAGRVIRFEVPE